MNKRTTTAHFTTAHFTAHVEAHDQWWARCSEEELARATKAQARRKAAAAAAAEETDGLLF